MVLLIHDSLLIPSYFPRCHPLSPPRTPHVTPPTPVGPSTPPAAPKQVSHRRFCLWSAPNPASAPRCSPLFVASPQYTLNPRSAVGRDPRRPPMPEFPARQLRVLSASAPRAFRMPQTNRPKLWPRRAPATTPTQFPVLEQPLAPQEEDTIMDNPELEMVINLFNEQWNMFVQARESQNPQLMRVALIQAISSQEEIRVLAGGAEMLRICENWIAREELADLERSQLAQQNQQATRLAITQTPHEHTISPSPAPQHRSTRQSSDVTFLGAGPLQQGSNPTPPPPPPSTRPPLAIVRQNPAQQMQPYHQQTHPQHREGVYYQQQPQQETMVQNYAPQTRVVPNYAPQPPHHPPQQRSWRGSGRNWRRPQDQTSRLLEVGDYLMRAERIAGRVFRTRGRGRARGRGRRPPPQQEGPPALNHQ
ncbi:hypothetical protein PGTUg99_010858 [Puccinia graminis f. sp. tritici]|uniref:Uncharacterized protein n=1 Tax=Puccinia graminis f. sp. tritici TaxID=56615 RepID=A0A5B0QRL9_PUCGR|nr:hypothetical protein PGTUg99_010858 [Puccinia graminis f. sp. tritici]